MKHTKRFEEIFKEKYEGIINKAQIEKGAKMRLKVLDSERQEEKRHFKGRH